MVRLQRQNASREKSHACGPGVVRESLQGRVFVPCELMDVLDVAAREHHQMPPPLRKAIEQHDAVRVLGDGQRSAAVAAREQAR